ncbi:MAG TPA: hypothetical protein VF348_05955 [Usitatibacter sp.]
MKLDQDRLIEAGVKLDQDRLIEVGVKLDPARSFPEPGGISLQPIPLELVAASSLSTGSDARLSSFTPTLQ